MFTDTLVVFSAPAASKNVTATTILGSTNTIQGISTTTSVNSITNATGSTGEEPEGISREVFHCSIYDGYHGNIGEGFYISAAKWYPDSKSDVYIDAVTTIKCFL